MTTSGLSFHFRLEDENPVHVRIGVFAGTQVGQRGRCGELVMAPDEWALLEQILYLGAGAARAQIDFTKDLSFT